MTFTKQNKCGNVPRMIWETMVPEHGWSWVRCVLHVRSTLVFLTQFERNYYVLVKFTLAAHEASMHVMNASFALWSNCTYERFSWSARNGEAACSIQRQVRRVSKILRICSLLRKNTAVKAANSADVLSVRGTSRRRSFGTRNINARKLG